MAEEKTKLEKILGLDVSEYTEKKGKFSYLSWSHAWREFIKIYPEAKYKIKKSDSGVPCFGSEQTGFIVYTEVTADDLTHEMWLPVLDFKNKTIFKPTMFDINTAVMRCLTKNLAMFGLGLYIYAGEDLPPDIEKPELNEDEIKKELKKLTSRDDIEKYYKSSVHFGNNKLIDLCSKRTKYIENL